MEYIIVLAVALVGLLMFFGSLFFSFLVAPHKPNPIKNSPYECGEKPIGHAWIQFNVGYYLFALLFLILDVEAAFLYPWAVAFRELGFVGLIEAGFFVLVLVLAVAYAWRKGALEWV
jgi:NADH:ubiquinone oxidoreductase subunit 3 (subunit A)